MPSIAIIAPKGGVGKSTITECLRQVYEDAQIIDMDHQQTLTVLATINKKPLPVQEKDAKAKYILYDTPPYNDEEIRGLIKIVDKVVIPIKGGPPDLAAFPTIYQSLEETNAFGKTLVVFNEVRKPITNVHKNLKKIFYRNFPKVKIAKTNLSNLNDFKSALFSKLEGEGLKQIKDLVKEINL